MKKEITDRYYIQSLARGITILERIASLKGPRTLSELSEDLGLPAPSLFRFLYTFGKLGLIERDPVTRQYQITPRILKLGHGVFATSDLWRTAHPMLEKARRQYNETFNLAILDGTDIIYIDRAKTRSILTINLEIGSKLPAYCTSMGRVLLAGLPEEEAVTLLHRSPREAHTKNTVTDIDQLMHILETVRNQGYALNLGELAIELWSCGAPVRNRMGRVIAALNMAVNAAAHETSYIDQVLIPAVLAVSYEISSALGYVKDR